MKCMILILFLSANVYGFWGKRKCSLSTCGSAKYLVNNLEKLESSLKKYKFQEELIKEILDRATITNPNHASPKLNMNHIEKVHCKEKQLSLIKNLKISPKAKNLQGTIINGCVDSTKTLLNYISPSEISLALKTIKIPSRFDEAYQRNIGASMKELLKKSQSICKETKQLCEAKKKIKVVVLDYEKRYQTHKYWQSPKGKIQHAHNQICEYYSHIKSNQKRINEEKEKGKISGFVNVIKMKNAGDNIHWRMKQIQKMKEDLFKIEKKKFDEKKHCS